jgi:hypothetical protein
MGKRRARRDPAAVERRLQPGGEMLRTIAALALLAALNGCQAAPQPEPDRVSGDDVARTEAAIGRDAGNGQPAQAIVVDEQAPARQPIAQQHRERTRPRSCYTADPTLLCF